MATDTATALKLLAIAAKHPAQVYAVGTFVVCMSRAWVRLPMAVGADPGADRRPCGGQVGERADSAGTIPHSGTTRSAAMSNYRLYPVSAGARCRLFVIEPARDLSCSEMIVTEDCPGVGWR